MLAPQRFSLREEQFFLLLAVLIGIGSGLAVVCFRMCIEFLHLKLLGTGLQPSVPRVFLAPMLAGLVIAALVIRFFPRARGSGVNQTKAALYIYDGYIPMPTVIGKFVTSALAIGSGQSLGPEDPALQIGAGLASALGRRLKLSREKLRLIAPVGAAAGLAAAFNAPITAVLFVIEEVIGRWTAGILGAVVLSAISSAVVARWFLGDEALFRVPAYHLEHPIELLAYASLGVIGGFASLIFVKYIAFLRPRLRQYPSWTQYFQPAAAGLLVGFIGIKFPQVMGAGYTYIDQAMHEQYTWQVLAVLGALKILTTGLSFSSGTPGGLFAPTLFMGAMIGGAVGMAERQIVPYLAIPVGAYALVGMGTLFAGNSARAHDLGVHDPGGQRQLQHHRSRHPLERDRIFHLANFSADADLRSALPPGRPGLALARRRARGPVAARGRCDASAPGANPYRQHDSSESAGARAGFGAGVLRGRHGRRRLVWHHPSAPAQPHCGFRATTAALQLSYGAHSLSASRSSSGYGLAPHW